MKNIVEVKYGSSSVSCETGLDMSRLTGYAAQLAELHRQYEGLIIVTSGAVAVGRCLWRQANPDAKHEPSLRSLAMTGSAPVVTGWQHVLGEHGLIGAQLLVTHDELDDKKEARELVTALDDNIRDGIVTIANENDALSVTELNELEVPEVKAKADNDRLAAHLAKRARVSRLFLLTDVEGIMMNDHVIPEVEPAQYELVLNIAGQASGKGRGGMRTKATAAILAAEAGIDTYIAQAGSNFDEIVEGKVGTHFVPLARTAAFVSPRSTR